MVFHAMQMPAAWSDTESQSLKESARMAKVAQAQLAGGTGNPDFYKRKLTLAKYWMEREMPASAALVERIRAGADTLMELDQEQFVA